MLKKLASAIAASMALVIGSSASADWLFDVTVMDISTVGDSHVQIAISPNHHDPDQCGRANTVDFVNINGALHESRMALLIAALTTGKLVNIEISGCNGPDATATNLGLES